MSSKNEEARLELVKQRLAAVLCPKRCHVNGEPCSYHRVRAAGAAPGVLAIAHELNLPVVPVKMKRID